MQNERRRRCAHPLAWLGAAGLLALVLVPVPSSASDVIDRVLAVVSGDIITMSDVRGALLLGLIDPGDAPDPVAAALERLIERRLVLLEVERYGPAEPPADMLEQRLAVIRARQGEARFAAALQQGSFTEARLRMFLRDDVRIERYIDQRFGSAGQPTEDEVVRYFREHEASFVRGGAVPAYPEVREEARARLAAERHRQLIAEWIASLRRRADVTVLLLPSR